MERSQSVCTDFFYCIKDTVEKEIGPPTWHLYTLTPTYLHRFIPAPLDFKLLVGRNHGIIQMHRILLVILESFEEYILIK